MLLSKVATTVEASIAAPRDAFFAWLVPGVFSNQLETVLRDAASLPGVAKTTDTTGPWDVPGSTRIVHLTDGTRCRETVQQATAPDSFAYRLTEFSSPPVAALVKEAGGQWWFTDEAGGTHAKWTYTAESKNPAGIILLTPIIKILWNHYMTAALEVIKTRAEAEVGKGTR
jgi:hypothetical protein